jgi:hypothetical protein
LTIGTSKGGAYPNLNDTHGDLIQVAYVVKDLDMAMKKYWEIFKIGPWVAFLNIRMFPGFSDPMRPKYLCHRNRPYDIPVTQIDP